MRYAVIENSICVNVIVAEPDFAKEIGAVEILDGYGIGDIYSDGEWSKAPEPEPQPEPGGDTESRLIALEKNKADKNDLTAIAEAIERGLAL